MSRINWKVFGENSSSADALYEFIWEGAPLSKLADQMWDPKAKREARKLVRLGVRAARLRAIRATRRWGWQ